MQHSSSASSCESPASKGSCLARSGSSGLQHCSSAAVAQSLLVGGGMLEQQSSQPGPEHHENARGAVASQCSAEQPTPQRMAAAEHAVNEMKQQSGEDSRAPPRSLLSAELRSDVSLKEVLSPDWVNSHIERGHVDASDFLDPSLFDDRSSLLGMSPVLPSQFGHRLSAWPEAREYYA